MGIYIEYYDKAVCVDVFMMINTDIAQKCAQKGRLKRRVEMKEIRIYVRTEEEDEIEKCLNVLYPVLEALFESEDIIITTGEVEDED